MFPGKRRDGDERFVFVPLHRRDFEREAGNFGSQPRHASTKIIVRDEFRMFARDEQNISESLLHEITRFAEHLLDLERHAQDRILPREPAIFAAIDAFIRQIKRREHPHHTAEMLQRHRVRGSRHRVQFGVGLRRNQLAETPEARR